MAVLLSLIVVSLGVAFMRHRQQEQLAVVQAKYDEIAALFDDAKATLAAAERHHESVAARMDAYVAFFEDSGYPVAIINSRGDVIEWNNAAEKDTGYSFEEIKALGRGIAPIIPPEMQADHEAKSQAAFSDAKLLGKVQYVDCWRVRKPREGQSVGTRRKVRVAVFMFRDGDEVLGAAFWVPLSKVEESTIAEGP